MEMMKFLYIFCLYLQAAIVGAAPTLEQDAPTLERDAAAGDRAFRAGHAHELFLRRILDESSHYGNFSSYTASPHTVPLTVGIVGAGAAGLYSAVLLQSLGIDYEVLEANTRIGGKIFTYRFDEEKWLLSKPGEPDYYNYYDVGPMRLPALSWMDRVFGVQNTSLVSYINARVEPENKLTLIPYYYQADNTFRMYNNRRVYNQVTPSAATFDVLASEGGTIASNSSIATMSAGAVLDDALKVLLDALNKDFDTGFNQMMEYDSKSVRQYLYEKGYTTAEVDWLETVNEATEHYDTFSLSQLTLEQWIFDESPRNGWQCVEGGMDRLANGMVKILRKPVVTSKRVTGLKPGPGNSVVAMVNGAEERTYAHVINTAPLGPTQHMDMTELNLDYAKKLAIRKLRYDPAGKIGMTFKTRWWETLSAPFHGGQSFTDLPIRRVVYPSYGIHTPNAAAAMIASYTWGQDSARLGASYGSAESEAAVVATVLRDLARLHDVSEAFLRDQLVDYHVWDWYGHALSAGGFAMFSPSQFSALLPPLLRPAHAGRVHFAGDALSAGHGWMIGALNSAYRTVAEILAVEGLTDKLEELVDLWGVVDEVDMGWYTNTA